MGPTWVLSAPRWPHVGLMNLAIWVVLLVDNNITSCTECAVVVDDVELSMQATFIFHVYSADHMAWPTEDMCNAPHLDVVHGVEQHN